MLKEDITTLFHVFVETIESIMSVSYLSYDKFITLNKIKKGKTKKIHIFHLYLGNGWDVASLPLFSSDWFLFGFRR